MAELLLEIRSEEIPSRMQARAAADLQRLFVDEMKRESLDFEGVEVFATPRRLTLVVDGLPVAQPDLADERRGPRIDAPDKAIEGFLKSAGISRDEAEHREEKKGTFLYACIERKGAPTADVLERVIPEIIRSFPWPKSMRWGTRDLRWVRPLTGILCILDGGVVSFDVDGIRSGAQTSGHRFLAPEPYTVESVEDYQQKLLEARVILNPEVRKKRILAKANELAEEQGVTLADDPKILSEVAGLVEWPVPLLGAFSPDFLTVPPECLISEMKEHQKYLPLFDRESGELSPNFIAVANLDTVDGGDAIRAGNERVLAARLSDARFFWQQDAKVGLEDRVADLEDIVFHAKLGTVRQKVERIEALARQLAPFIPDCDEELAARAAHLCKADLVTGMVGEFPDLQGVMGRYYAIDQGEDSLVADAIRDHYSPVGPSDDCPTAPISVAIALADKLDTLVGFFSIDEKPTGSKDPFALRRAALGVVRLIIENELRIELNKLIPSLFEDSVRFASGDLTNFIIDRLKVQQREMGVQHDLIEAVFQLDGELDLVSLLARVSALTKFLATEDGESLLAGYRRAANIVRIEEKKSGEKYTGDVDPGLLSDEPEKALFKALGAAKEKANAAIQDEQYESAMAALADLRPRIDKFFDDVTVNADDSAIRANRLRLLRGIQDSTGSVADFSKITS